MPKIAGIVNYPQAVSMPAPMSRCLVVLSTLFLANCSSQDVAWPNLADVPPVLKTDAAATATPPAPPTPSVAQADGVLDKASTGTAALASRLAQHESRLTMLKTDLARQAAAVTSAVDAGRGADPDLWGKVQADISGLNQDIDTLREVRADVADDAAAGAGIVSDLRPLTQAPDLDAASAERTAAASEAINAVLARLGTLDREITDSLAEYERLSGSQAARLEGPAMSRPVVEPAPEPAPAKRPALRKPRPKPQAEAAAPQDSGDRFKGRQPLVTLTFDDPNLDFETRLRGLIDKVRAQYPDIAFDVENLGAAPEQLQKVRAMLKSLDIPLALYNAPVPANGTPSIKLYPR
ncbi:hypothetical protein [Iodidimonas sp. SYSU 1G8]|uniref:hypothetical protein n=1 Tax=Iodidimonas sp. SYSU 1G8 TaxID=3133967 RepID=UPI0031FF368E